MYGVSSVCDYIPTLKLFTLYAWSAISSHTVLTHLLYYVQHFQYVYDVVLQIIIEKITLLYLM